MPAVFRLESAGVLPLSSQWSPEDMDDDKPRLRATMRQMYQGRALKAGDEFVADSEQDALDLEAARMAERLAADNAKRTYRRRDLKAQE